MSATSSRALWFIGREESRIRDTVLPELKENRIQIKSHFSAISPGTERLVFQGLVPPSMYSRMAVPYMEGDFSFPIKYGYSLVGEITRGNESLIGQRVHVMHPHQDIAVVDTKDVQILPPSIPYERATLISNTETCVNAIWDSNVQIGDRIVIVGFGAIGSLLSLILKQMNLVDIHVVDVDPKKLRFARDLGFSTYSVDQLKEDYYDLSFHCSATGDGLQTAINSVSKEGRVIELSWYGSKSIEINLGTSFHVNRKQIISSQVSSIPSDKSSKWNFKRRKKFVLRILENDEFDKLITSTIKFEEIDNQFGDLCISPSPNLSPIIDYL